MSTAVLGEYSASGATNNDFSDIKLVGYLNGQPVAQAGPHNSTGVYETAYPLDYSDFNGKTIDTVRGIYSWSGSSNVYLSTTNLESITVVNATTESPPAFESGTPTVGSISQSGGTLSVDLDEDGTAFYVVVPDGAGMPTAVQVKAGQNSTGGTALVSGSMVTSGTTASEAFGGLILGTSYDLYVVAEDLASPANVQSVPTKVDFVTAGPDADGNVTEGAGIVEPVGLDTTIHTSGDAINLFDFTLSDGGTSDGLPMAVSQVVVNVSGTSTDTERTKITWRLNGPDASNVTGTYSAAADTITFPGLSISVADGASETYTINAFYNDNRGLTEDNTIILSVDGDTDLTVESSGTRMAGTSSVHNGTGTTIDVVATQLAFVTQPAGSTSGSALSTQPMVAARDAFGNTDVDFSETVTLTESSAGALSNSAASSVSGMATFTSVIYTATSDQESFTLIANDQDSVGTDLPPVNANTVTSDVVATKLLFDTQPSPASVTSGSSTAFTTVPVIRAVDANDITDTGYSTNIMIAEINGAGSATMSGTGDLDGDGSTVTLAPGVGVATFTGLQITYTASGASNENFNLQASSGGLSSATSTQLTASVTPTITSVSVPANATYVAGQNLDVTVNTSGAITVNTAGGTPRIVLDIGGSTAYANYLSGSGTNSLAFRYTLQSGDLDTDGIGIATLDPNGGTLQNSSGNDLDITLNAVGSTAAILVDAVNPTVSSVTVPSAGRYVAGNNLDFTLNVSEILTLNTGGGVPRIPLTLGSTTRYASYISGSGTASLVFRYVVQSGDEDTDGVTVAAAVDSNGGTLKDAAGNDLVTTLNAVGDTSAILVDTIAPAGHSVNFDDSTLNAAEAASASFTFIAAEVGTDYSYTISSNGGGTPVTGSGTVATASDQITGVDLRGLADGTLTLSVTLTDTAGNSAVAVTDTATLDGTAATVTLSTAAAAVTNAAFEVAIVFSEAVDGFVVEDVTAVNAALSGFTGSGANYSVTVTPSNDGVATVDVASGVAQDAAGNSNVAATQLSRVFDGTAPTPVISTDANALTNGPINLTINFGEVVSGFVSGDLSVTNGNVTTFTDQGGGVFDLTVEAAADGNVVLSLPAAVADDEAGNASIAATPLTIAFDGSGPTLQSSSPSAGASAVSYQSGLTLTFDEPVFAVSGDLVLQDATEGVEHTRIAISGAGVVIVGAQVEVTLEKTLVPTHDYYVTVASGSLEDEAGNAWGGIQNDTTLSFTVGNEAPQANNDTATISQDQSVAIDLLANDTDLEGDLSPASVRMTTAPLHGQVTINTGTGVAIYTPEPGFNGSDSFVYVVEDQYRGQSAAATVAVNVVAEVRAPVARADVANGVPGDIVVLDLLANDSPGIGGESLDNVTLTLINRPLNGTAEIANGELTYVPEEGFGGIEQLRYSLTDPDGRVSNVADVWINLSDSNQPPVTLDDSAETPAATTLTLDILANDSDSEGALDPSSVSLMSLPAHGSVNLDEVTGRLTYAPDAGFRGEDRLTYVVRDAEGLVSPVAEVILAVGTNEAPVARDDQVRLVGDKVHAISVLGNDGNGSASLVSSSLRVVNTPLQGSVAVDAALGLLLYTPDAGFTGTDELTYTVEDDQGRVSAPAIVRIGSGIVNNVPVANPDRFVLEEDSSLTLDLLTNDQDLEAGLSRFDIVLIDTPRHGSVSVESDGTLIYSPDQHVFGEDRLTYRVSDAQGGESRVVSARLRITPKADVPLISGTPTRTVTAEEAYRFTPVVKDIDGNPLQFSILNKPIWATFDDTTGRLSGTPGVAQVGVTEGIVIS
ncbi:Ig-like domain-containing protein, partial [Marinobacter sp.]|uniref:Ig-like domain-containing protein n=1 Tax=Marinobacter sp. TaxID=50741 RepID=UPI00258A2474